MLIPPVPSSALHERALVPGQKRFTTRRASFPHAAWLGQASAHCPIFLTAASRRSLVRVSVPVWGTVLSDPLPIAGLVGRHPANYLMGRMPVPHRIAAFQTKGCPLGWTWGITRRFHRLSPSAGLVAYALRTRAPLSATRRPPPVRLACIRPAASVHPEPGSNSSLYYCCTCKFSCLGLRYDSFSLLIETYRPSRPSASDFLCWPQPFKELRPRLSPLSLPRFFEPKTGAKLQLFFFPASFFYIFLKKIICR